MNLPLFIPAAMVLALFVCSALFADTNDNDVPNFYVMEDGLATAGQPSEEGFQQLYKQGYRTVLNLRTSGEGSEEEGPLCQSIGFQYKNIPVMPDTLSMGKVKKFHKIVQNEKKRPLIIHCKSANRVGGMWYLSRTLLDKIPQEQALKEARAIGLQPGLETVVREWHEKQSE